MQAFISHPTPSTQTLNPSWGYRIQQQLLEWGDRLCHSLTPPQDDVQIRQRERNGVTTWIVYDRITEERQQLTSEAAVHAWLEQRYR